MSIETSRFDDKRNIHFATGRIIWARACRPVIGNTKYFPEGWVLPGGERTTDRERALQAVHYIASCAK